MALATPIYDPAQAITGRATGAAVTGGRVVCVAATKADGEPTPIKHCGATDEPLGVAGDDVAQNGDVVVYKAGFVVPVLAGGTGVTAGKIVEALATGTVQDIASGKRVGLAITTAAAAAYALVVLQT